MLDDAGIRCNRNMHPEMNLPSVEIQLILLISGDTQKKNKYVVMV